MEPEHSPERQTWGGETTRDVSDRYTGRGRGGGAELGDGHKGRKGGGIDNSCLFIGVLGRVDYSGHFEPTDRQYVSRWMI